MARVTFRGCYALESGTYPFNLCRVILAIRYTLITQRGRTFYHILKLITNSSPHRKFFTHFFMILFIAYGDYSVAAAGTSGMENVQFINFIIKFSNFHRVFCTADGQIGH